MHSISFKFRLQQKGVIYPGIPPEFLNILKISVNVLQYLITQDMSKVGNIDTWNLYTTNPFIVSEDVFDILFTFDYRYQLAGYKPPYYSVTPVLMIDDIKVNEYFHVIDPSFESYSTLFNAGSTNMLTPCNPSPSFSFFYIKT
jgi:hypothetical protein